MNNIKEYFSNFFETYIPKKVITKKEEESKPIDTESMKKFFGKDLLTELGQGTIKKEHIRREKKTIDEQLSPEMEAEIKEIFGEDSTNIF